MFCYAAVPPTRQELPKVLQDSWIIGFTAENLILSATAIQKENENLFVIEIQNFLNENKIITADGYRRCNTCHVFTELHENVLAMQTSDCLSQVKKVFLNTY